VKISDSGRSFQPDLYSNKDFPGKQFYKSESGEYLEYNPLQKTGKTIIPEIETPIFKQRKKRSFLESTTIDTPKSYTCDVCQSTFDTEEQFKDHFKKYHIKIQKQHIESATPVMTTTSPVDYVCSICQRRFITKEDLNIHEISDHSKTKTGAPLTPIAEATPQQPTDSDVESSIPDDPDESVAPPLNLSSCKKKSPKSLSKEKSNPHKCRFCQKVFRSAPYLIEHLKNVHVNDMSIDEKVKLFPTNCPHCNKRYTSVANVKKHILSEHPTLPNPFEESLSKGSSIKSHKQPTPSSIEFKCDICNKRFKTKMLLASHKLQHSKDIQKGKGKSYKRWRLFV
jgi:hypothetical protein